MHRFETCWLPIVYNSCYVISTSLLLFNNEDFDFKFHNHLLPSRKKLFADFNSNFDADSIMGKNTISILNFKPCTALTSPYNDVLKTACNYAM